MRKDVKIGLGIGGVLLAVLIVYALVPKNNDTANEFARTGDTAKSDEHAQGGTANTNTGGATSPNTSQQVATNDTTGHGVQSHDATGHGVQSHDATGHDAATPTNNDGVASRDTGAGEAAEQETTQATTPRVDWEKILRTGLVPDDAKVPLAARQGNADDVFGDVKGNPGGEPKWDVKENAGKVTPPAGANHAAQPNHAAQGNQPAQPKPQAAAGKGPTEHTVQQGENLSMIAAVAYGDARKYKEILKANPGLDEKKLRPGTTIKMPDASTFAAPATPAATATAKGQPAKLDPKTQYEVEKDDNLSRISAKLYGTTAKSKALYEANKDKIGDDPAKLKLGTILKLPEPPTQQQAAR